MSNMILGAIAYVDTLTAAILGTINQTDHQTAIKLLRKALGDALPRRRRGTCGHCLE